MQDQEREPIKFENLPSDIQEAISDAKLTEKIQSIGKKYSLHIDQIGDLEDEVTLVMFGVIDPKTFVSEIANRLEIEENEASGIVNDINAQIFVAIKESLQKIYSQKDTPVETEADHRLLTKEDILKDIEEPTPTLVRKESYQMEGEGAAPAAPLPVSTPVSSAPTNLPTEEKTSELVSTVNPASNSAPLNNIHSMLSSNPDITIPKTPLITPTNKLNEIVTSPKKEIDLSNPPTRPSSDTPESNKYSAVDPYRESIS